MSLLHNWESDKDYDDLSMGISSSIKEDLEWEKRLEDLPPLGAPFHDMDDYKPLNKE